jgi:hypothetical protein
LPYPLAASLVALLAAVIATVQASFMEWTFHRYWLHRPRTPKSSFTSHTLVHHRLCAFDDTFVAAEPEQEESMTFKWWGGPVLVAINSAPWALASLGLAALGIEFLWVPFLIGFTVMFSIYFVGYEGLHYLMHKPKGTFLERNRAFRFLENHHRIHHKRMDRNLNVFFPLADYVLGTRLAEMPAQVATPPSARERARKHSEFGRRLRGETR